VLALCLSFSACIMWGIADFIGGLKSRHLPTITVVMLSNSFGVAVVSVIVLIRGKALPANPLLLWAIAAGIIGLFALFFLYKGLAVGSMSIIAPISSTGVIIPVIYGLLFGDTLSNLQIVGIPMAIIGTVLAAIKKTENEKKAKLARGVWYAIGSAITIGIYFIFIDRASNADPYWTTFILLVSYVVFLFPVVILTRTSLRVNRSHVPSILVLGILGALAGAAFALATTVGMLSLVSVVGSLYPAITIVMSAVILHERPQLTQILGVIVALIGVVCISAG